MIPKVCQAAILEAVGEPLHISSVPLVEPSPGQILAKIRMATICGSDLHTFKGRRVENTPLILGHEIVAEVAALGRGVHASSTGRHLEIGDRVSFTIMASCGECRSCKTDLPQKCESLFKYGHASLHDGTGLNGGFADYIYLRPGTGVFHVPGELSDKEVCPANCALATVINGLDVISSDRTWRRPPEKGKRRSGGDIVLGDRVLVQGAGLLGLYTTALAKENGVPEVVVTDIDDARLAMAKRFRADEVLNVKGMADDQIIDTLGSRLFDCAVEVSGDPSVVRPGVELLDLRGRYLIIGLVCAGSHFTVDGNTVTRRYLTINGIHNYAPQHLARALRFLEKTKSSYPYEELVGLVFPLEEAQEAFDAALNRHSIRVALAPEHTDSQPAE